MVTLTSRSASGTPDSAVSLRIFALRARADPRRDLDDLEAAPGSDLVAPQILEQLLVGFGLLGDALHDDGGAFLGLREREGLDARRARHAGNRVAVRARARHPEHLGEP